MMLSFFSAKKNFYLTRFWYMGKDGAIDLLKKVHLKGKSGTL